MSAEQSDIHARELRLRLWRNAWAVALVAFSLSWLYQLAYGDNPSWYTFAKALAGSGGLLIAASFALSGFCYYFDFLDTKLGYRKYLGLIGYYLALAYAVLLVVLYPELYGFNLLKRLGEAEVVLGLAAMAILTVMAALSNTKVMIALGPQMWRQCLRLGYLAMFLLVVRAYLIENEKWLAWLSAPQGLPPSRLVLSIIDLAVIGLRGSMLVSQYLKRRRVAQTASLSAKLPRRAVRIIQAGALAASLALAYLAYGYFTIRPVIAPTGQVQLGSASPASPPELTQASPAQPTPAHALATDASLSFLKLPPGFVINIFAAKLAGQVLTKPGPGAGPRLMTVIGEKVFVAMPGQGAILVLKDNNGDGRADWQQEFIGQLKRPHNLAYHAGWYYIAAEDGIYRVKDSDADLKADATTLEKIVNLPTGGHWTRTVKIINGELYISVGSTCNVCYETDELRAAITRCRLDGTACQTFAKGLRNTVDFVERDGQIYGTDNGRDHLGNFLPPEEVNLIVQDGDYGWPICYGQKIHDSDFDKNVYLRDPCADTLPPLVELPAHNAPLGLAFYEGMAFPPEYQGDLFVAAHGSWNRQPPDGYKIFRIDWETKRVSDFITGWLGRASVRGRPVGIVNYQNGLLVSDDAAGLIYLVRYAAR